MTTVAGKNRVNRPYFFTDTGGERMEIPAFGSGQGDLDGNQLAEFRMYERAGQIAPAAVQFPPANTVPPSITGTAQVGETLTGVDGEWTGTPAPVITRQWQADGEDIDDATGSNYVPVEDDIGAVVTLVVTATNDAGEASETSDPTDEVVAAFASPENTGAPEIAGNAEVGETLTASAGTWTGNPEPTYEYQWQRSATSGGGSWSDISGETDDEYELVEDDEDQYIRCVVTATNSEGSESENSNVVGPVEGEE